MSAALIGLAGVVIGGAIAAFVQLRSSARNVRGAARLVHDELDLSLGYLESVRENPTSQTPGQALASGVWVNVRNLLAAELGRKDWLTVNKAYRTVYAIRLSPSTRLLTLDDPVLDRSIEEIRAACAVLDALSGSFPSITQTLRRRRRG